MKFGIIGTNFVSDMFMQAASGRKEVQAYAVASGHRANADAFAKKYSIPLVYDSLEQMLQDHKVDAVYLAVPNSMHESMSLACIQAGIPVFCEKPFMPTLLQAQSVYQQASLQNVYVHDGLVPLYGKHFRQLKQALPSIGRIHTAVFTFSRYSSRFDAYRAGKNPTTFQKKYCNGSLMDMGVYCIGDAIALFGMPERIQASASLLDTGVDGSAEAVFHYQNFDAVILCSKSATSYQMSEIQGEEGTILIDMPSRIRQAWMIARNDQEKKAITDDQDDAFGEQLDDFVSSVSEGRKESALLPHALSLEIIEALQTCRLQAGVVFDCDREDFNVQSFYQL